jgi:hypothetical protein
LKEIKKKQIHNPLVIITKSPLRKEILKAVSEIGLKVIFFLSYSGLGPSYERGIDRKKLQENFFLVKAYNFPLVHFWRPLIPTLNTHIRDLQDMLSFVSSIADATVFIGLKLHPELNRIIYAEGEIPIPDSSMDKKGEWLEEKTINRIYKEANRICPHYPLYRHSSCAIAALLHIPNHTATLYRNDICPPSQCPEAQREICENSRRIPDENEITKGLAVLERHIDFERHTNAVWINSEISQEEFAFLIHQFNFPLKTKKIKMQNLFYGDIYKNQTKIDENS